MGISGSGYVYYDYADTAAVACVCELNDSFNRPNQTGFGTSDSGVAWDVFTDFGGIGEISNGAARMRCTSDSDYVYAEVVRTGCPSDKSFLHRFKIVEQDTTPGGGQSQYFGGAMGTTVSQGGEFYTRLWSINVNSALGTGQWLCLVRQFPAVDVANAKVQMNFTTGVWYWVRWENDDGVEQRLKVWQDGSGEPASWTLTTSLVGVPTNTDIIAYAFDMNVYNDQSNLEVLIDDLEVCYVDAI